MSANHVRVSTVRLVRLAVLTAIILVMAYTPLGYLRTAGLEISFLTLPVIIGAIVLGPLEGAFLGGVFGLTSFIQCLSGASPFGATLLAIQPVWTFVVCVAARVLMGWLCGVIFKALERVDRKKLVCFGAAAVSGALLNTFFFMGGLVLFFYRTDFISGIAEAIGASNVLHFVVLFVGLQGLVEALVCFVAGAAISKALWHALNRRQPAKPY